MTKLSILIGIILIIAAIPGLVFAAGNEPGSFYIPSGNKIILDADGDTSLRGTDSTMQFEIGGIDLPGNLSSNVDIIDVLVATFTDTRTSYTTLANHSDLQIQLAAGRAYRIKAVLILDNPGGVGDTLRVWLASGVFKGIGCAYGGASSKPDCMGITNSGANLVTVQGTQLVTIEGIATLSSSTTVAVQWAQTSSEVTTHSMLPGSYLEIYRTNG